MSQQNFWNDKFSINEYFYGKEPNEFIKSCKENFDRNKDVLCLGEGEGRNAVFLAKKGFKVTALDASNIGLAKLQQFAEEHDVDILTKCIDLNHWEVNKKYGSIVSSYLHMHKNDRKRLFENIENALETNGYFIGEFFSTSQLAYNSGGPKDLDLLYSVEDFKESFSSCEKIKVEEVITHLNEGKGHQGEASVIRVILQKK